jgi:mannitol 2-dehydrogenase
MQPTPLSRATLRNLDPRIAVPRYDPAAVTPGIVHLGLGGFHRAHMARYTHEPMNLGGDALRWGIVGAGLLPSDRGMADALSPQDGLYTLVERQGDDEHVAVIGSIAEVIFAAEDSSALLEAIDRPEIRIVSLTVTEHGYCLNRATRRLDPTHPAIAADLAAPTRPHSAIGIIVEAYRRRRAAGAQAFTAMSCDNIQHNGAVLRDAVLDYAALLDADLAAWIAAEARFPATMVDRITPVTTADNTADLAARYGVADNWPVFAEIFTQWVIEDDFTTARPAWEEAGAQFVDDVAPYELMKLRLLNASHLAIAGIGRLIGYTYIHETIQDPLLRRYMTALMSRETAPTLLPVPGVDLATYQATLIERFANPRIADTVERVNTDAPLNVLLDPARDRLARGEHIDLLALAVAAWLRRVRGEDETGALIDIRHPMAAELREKAIEGGGDPQPLLGMKPLFGDLGDHPAFGATIGKWLASLYDVGAAATLAKAAEALAF